MLIIATIVGALVGASFDRGGFGLVAGALLGWLLARDVGHARGIAALRRALAEAGAVPREGAVPRAAPEAASAEAPPAPAAETPAAPALTPHAAAADEEAVPSTIPLSLPSPPEPAPPRAPGLLDAVRAWFLGGNTIVKAGVGILFVGLAFLAKYATEHVQVPVEFRLGGIGAAALALLALGWRLRRARPGYAQALQGGAVAVLYLTLFAAFRYFGLIGVGPAFALMVAVAALAAALAVLQDAPALALIGALGGFMTPLLVASGSGNAPALFGYYLVLDLGIAAVAWFRTWRLLNLVGFACTFVVAAAWGVLRFRPEDLALGEGFLGAYFLLFNAVMLMPARRAEAAGPAERWLNGSLLFGLPTITFVLQHGMVRHVAFASALSALALAAFYVTLAAVARSRPRLAAVFEGSLAVAMVFVTLVIPFALDVRSTAGAWALEGAGLAWIGRRQARRLPRAFGLALLVLAGLWLDGVHAFAWGGAEPGFPSLAFNALLIAAAACAAAFFERRPPMPALPGEGAAEPLAIGWGTLWALVALHWALEGVLAREPDAALPALWLAGVSALALVLGALAARLDWPRIALPALGHAPAMALVLLVSEAAGQRPFGGAGAWAWPLAALAHVLLLRWAAPRWPAPGAMLVHALGVLVLAGLGAAEGSAVTREWGDGASAWGWLGWFALPALLLLALPSARLAARWPLRSAPAAYGAAAGVLAALLWLWTLAANGWSDGTAAPLPYVPLLSPLDLGIALALFGIGRWLRSEGAQPLVRAAPALAPAALGGAGFVWLNGMLLRSFHHHGGVPYALDAWMRSFAVQAGLTLLWSATALVLMWVSARRALRLPWMGGAALLALVVLKLLLVDLAGTGTVARIVSFIGVGVLMLVIGYVAPLPGKGAGDAR